jgi:transcriptional regulator with XRE-family HTH domain
METIILTSDNIRKVGNILYKIRVEDRQISQADVADKMEKGQGQVSGMENNRKIPGLKNIISYLDAVGGWKLAIIRAEDQPADQQATE